MLQCSVVSAAKAVPYLLLTRGLLNSLTYYLGALTSASCSGRMLASTRRTVLGGAPSAKPGGGEDTVLASAPGGRSYADRHAAVEGLQPAY